MADYCFLTDSIGDTMDIVVIMYHTQLASAAVVSSQEKEPIHFAIDSIIENLRRGGSEKFTIRIDSEPAITSLFWAIQEMRRCA